MTRWLAALLCTVVTIPLAAAERWEGTDLRLLELSLVLNDDGTYRYANQTGSCWIDWDECGTWEEAEGGLLVLTSDTDAARVTYFLRQDRTLEMPGYQGITLERCPDS